MILKKHFRTQKVDRPGLCSVVYYGEVRPENNATVVLFMCSVSSVSSQRGIFSISLQFLLSAASLLS